MKAEVLERLKKAEAAQSDVAEKRAAELQRMQSEIDLVRKHAALSEQVDQARSGFAAVEARMAAACQVAPVERIAAWLADDWGRIDLICAQQSEAAWLRAHQAEILSAMREVLVGEREQQLRAFESAHAAMLKKYGAV